MLKRIQKQLLAFFKKWRVWTVALAIWVISLIRDYYATNILLWLNSQYGGKVEIVIRDILLSIPKDASEWALLVFVITIAGVLVYNIREERISGKLKTTQDPNNNTEIPTFYTRLHHAEFLIKDSNADEVAKFIFQYLNDIPWFSEGDNCFMQTNGGKYYNPEKDEIFHHGFVAQGEKSIAVHGYTLVGGAKITADPVRVYLPEMFFIKVVQGGENSSLVIFDTDDKDVFSAYPKGLLKQLQEVFQVTSIKGLKEEIVTRGAEVWKNITIEEFSFPLSSLFGLGLKVKSNRRIESISAELKYVVNTNTKEVPIIIYHILPWATGDHSCEYEPQAIGKGEERNLVVLCWNKEKREIWFPTSSSERTKRGSVIVVDDGVTRERFRIRDNRTQIIGKNFYFEVQFNASISKKSVSFTWKGYLVSDGDRAMMYDSFNKVGEE